MAWLHLLGTGAALAPSNRTTTMLAVEDDSVILVDCGGDVIHRALASGIDLARIRLLVLTHEHPDHVCGFPLFMEKIWLSGRRSPIPVAGPQRALLQARRIFEAFDTSGWKGMPAIEWREVPLEEGAPVWEDDEWRVTAAPGDHGVPVIGVRLENLRSGGVVAHSSDTAPTDAIARLARGVDILVHEATGDFPGHSTASAAARIGVAALARHLVLVHLPPMPDAGDLTRALEIFPGLDIGEDGARYAF